MRITRFLLALALLAWPMAASAQTCQGQFQPGYACANAGVSLAPPNAQPITAILDSAFGTQQGTILNRSASVWGETATPVLGVPGSLQGSIGLAGLTSGTVTLRSAAASATYTLQFPINGGTVGYVLTTDGTGITSWSNPTSGGTVTSVGLSAPAEFTVTVSPITTAGNLTFVKASQSANLGYLSPNGSSGVPTFRALVGADLPNPTVSSKGGVEAINAVTSNWINAINGSGVPQLSQPAFSDISGTVAASQLPNPTATTLGGVKSLAQVVSNWINSISTSGQPVASQPAFSDISGTVSPSQLPVIGNNTILSNITGATGPASGNQVSPILDSALGNVQGEILYRGASAWVVLGVGTMGQVLTTGGAAANPSWTTVTGTGTVTEVDTSGGITGGPITASGTVSLASIATGHVLAFTGSVSGTPVATTPSTVLDVIGSTQGDVLYRGASVWAVLAPGSNGQVLQTTGAGGSPQWASVDTYWTLSGSTVYNNTGTKVGIGTSSPSGTLGVLGSPGSYAFYVNGGLNYMAPSAGSAANGLQIDAANLVNSSNILLLSAPTGWTGNFVAATLNGVSKFAVAQNGNGYVIGTFGVGVASPAGTFDVENGAGTAQSCLNSSCEQVFFPTGFASVTPNQTNAPGYTASAQNTLNGFGQLINTSSSTTGGLAELDTASYNVGWPMLVSEWGLNAELGTLQYINISTPWNLNVHGLWNLDIKNTTINCGLSDETNPCVDFDSAQTGRIVMLGSQVVYGGSAYSVYVHPVNPTNQDQVKGFALMEFSATSIIGNSSTVAEIGVDLSSADSDGVAQNIWTVYELNGAGGAGSGTAYGFLVSSPPASPPSGSPGFTRNIVNLLDVHGNATSGVQIGQSQTAQNLLRNNIYNVFVDANIASNGMATYESNSLINISCGPGNALGNCLYLAPGAINNIVHILDGSGATTAVNDSAGTLGTTGNVIIGLGGISIGSGQPAANILSVPQVVNPNGTLLLNASTRVDLQVQGTTYFAANSSAFFPSSAASLTLGQSGNVFAGIWSTLPGGNGVLYSVCVAGSGQFFVRTAGGACSASSAKYKQNIENVSPEEALDIALALQPVTFHYRPEIKMGDAIHYGFIAGDVARVEPRLTTPDVNDPSKADGVNYEETAAIWAGAIQAMQHEINQLKAELATRH